MGTLQLDTMRDQLAVELAFTIATEIDADELNAAVTRATDELSRWIPLQLVAELHFDKAVVDDSITGLDSTAVTLANKPVRPLSETVTSDPAGTTYVRNDDYVMDYINGTLNVIPAGAIPNSTALLVSYDRDATLFDVSSLFTRPIAVTRVEYTIGGIPANVVSFDWHGDFLEITTGADRDSQGSIGDDQNIRIFYLAYHTPPTDSAGGSYPAYLDEIIQLGMGGFALRSAAMKERWLANAAIVSAKVETALANTTLDGADTDIASARTVLLAMRGSAGEPYDDAISTLVLAKTALDLVAVELTTDMNSILDTAVVNIDAARGSATEPFDLSVARSVTLLAEIVELDTAADSINTYITAATDSIHEALELLPALITAMNTDIDNVEDNLETDTENANAYMAAGDAFLNTVNTGGPNVPIEYLEYARTKIQAAQTWVAGAGMRGRNIEMKVAELQGRVSQVQSLIGEVSSHVAVVEGYSLYIQRQMDLYSGLISETNTRVAIAQGRRALADGHIAEASQRIAQAQGYLTTAGLIIQEATVLINGAQVQVGAGAQRIATASSYLLAADTDQAAADKLLEEADRRIGEFRNTIRDKSQVAMSAGALASRQQYA